jgi:hypothetical protein
MPGLEDPLRIAPGLGPIFRFIAAWSYAMPTDKREWR